jgi:hypothetical protein
MESALLDWTFDNQALPSRDEHLRISRACIRNDLKFNGHEISTAGPDI